MQPIMSLWACFVPLSVAIPSRCLMARGFRHTSTHGPSSIENLWKQGTAMQIRHVECRPPLPPTMSFLRTQILVLLQTAISRLSLSFVPISSIRLLVSRPFGQPCIIPRRCSCETVQTPATVYEETPAMRDTMSHANWPRRVQRPFNDLGSLALA